MNITLDKIFSWIVMTICLVAIFIINYIGYKILNPVKRQKNVLSAQIYDTFFGKNTFYLIYWKWQIIPLIFIAIIVCGFDICQFFFINWSKNTEILYCIFNLLILIAIIGVLIYKLYSLHKQYKIISKINIDVEAFQKAISNLKNLKFSSNNKKINKNLSKLNLQIDKTNFEKSNNELIKIYHLTLFYCVKLLDALDSLINSPKNDENKQEYIENYNNLKLVINGDFLNCINWVS